MIRFALRLSLAGGREAATRLVIIATAVALGVGMLLTTLAGMNAVGAQNQRYAWLNSSAAPASPDASADALWWLIREDYHHGDLIGRIDVAATGPDAPCPRASHACPARASTTSHPPSANDCTARRRRNSATASPAARSARSAGRPCRPPTPC